jgi:hypothetical protein
MQINSAGQPDNTYQLKGKMTVSNGTAEMKDSFTPSEDKSALGDFFHGIGDKIKYMFAKDGTPEKEGGYIPGPDGNGFVWCAHPDPDAYSPKPYTSREACWSLQVESCAPDVFYWKPYTDPTNEYGPYAKGGLMWGDNNNIKRIDHPDPKDYSSGGKWHLDTACGCCDWWWTPDKPPVKPEPPVMYNI